MMPCSKPNRGQTSNFDATSCKFGVACMVGPETAIWRDVGGLVVRGQQPVAASFCFAEGLRRPTQKGQAAALSSVTKAGF